jgi:hypothetical protein
MLHPNPLSEAKLLQLIENPMQHLAALRRYSPELFHLAQAEQLDHL